MSEQQVVGSPAVQAPVVVPVTTRDVLHRAADLLEEFGWCQGAMMRDGAGRHTDSSRGATSFCVGGAVLRAIYDFDRACDPGPLFTVGESRSWLDEALGVKYAGVWNDAPGRTRAEVVARLREAAEASDG